MTIAGKSQGVHIVTDADIEAGRFRLRPGPALKVTGITQDSRGVLGGNVLPVYIINDPSSRGVEGGDSVLMTNLTGIRSPIRDLAIPIYVVTDDDQFVSEELVYVGPIDGLSNVLGAYGLHRLSGDYDGSLCRLRRSGDDAEEDFGYIASGALDTAAIITWLSGADAFIKTLYNQSGGAAPDITQTTAAKQPQLHLTQHNNLPASIHVDDANDRYWVASPAIAAPQYLAAVLSFNPKGLFVGDSGGATIELVAGGMSDGVSYYDPASNAVFFGYLDGKIRVNGVDTRSHSGLHISTIERGGEENITGGDEIDALGSFGSLGGTNSFAGYMSAFIVIDTAIPPIAQQNLLGSRLSNIYGSTWTVIS